MTSSGLATHLGPEELFERNRVWAGTVARNVARKLPDNFDRGDLLNIALTKMWEKAQAYKPANGRPGRDPAGTPFQAFAYLAVRGACLMSVRRKAWLEAKHESLSDLGRDVDGAPHHVVQSHAANPEERLLSRITRKKERDTDSRHRRWIWKHVKELPQEDARLMRMLYIDKMEPEVIALHLGVDRATVGRRLAAIVKRLKKGRRQIPAPQFGKVIVKLIVKEADSMPVELDYTAVVADLEAKRTRIDQAIAGLERMRATRIGIVAAIAALKKVVAGEHPAQKVKAA